MIASERAENENERQQQQQAEQRVCQKGISADDAHPPSSRHATK